MASNKKGEATSYKITYHTNARNWSFYMKLKDYLFPRYGGEPFDELRIILNYIKNAKIEPVLLDRDCRVYWIDEEGDEIAIFFNDDFTQFLQRNKSPHMHIKARTDEPNESENTVDKKSLSDEKSAGPKVQSESIKHAIHHNIQCDKCLTIPIVGFRYKCLQCNDYDLCQICEAEHTHSEHLMIRIPNSDGHNALEYLHFNFGRRHGRKHSKRCKAGMQSDTAHAKANATDAFDEGKTSILPFWRNERCGSRIHQLPRVNSLWSNMYAIMRDLAEAGAPDSTSTIAKATQKYIQEASDAVALASGAITAAQIIHNSENDSTTNSTTQKDIPHYSDGVHHDDRENAENQSSNASGKKANANADFCEASTSTKTTPINGSDLHIPSQILDPQILKTGMQVLSNFGHVFNKIIETAKIDNADSNSATEDSACPSHNTNEEINAEVKACNNSQNQKAETVNTTAKENSSSTQSNPDNEESAPSNYNTENLVELRDLNEDSDSDWSSDSFIKINVSSNKSSLKGSERNNSPDSEVSPKAIPVEETSNANLLELNDKQNEISATLTTNNSTSTQDLEHGSNYSGIENTYTTTMSNVAIPVYHPDAIINDRILRMIEMGFSNHDNSLTRLMEVVGSVPEALDIMLASQRNAN